ncbi:LysR family transcriptional regulator [Vibrio amylolyticus]|uniref:LysR family transcriptional regulator n=1 Tax=Vibrio amylolyticus TaxID=2847292 RepID=UPI00355102DD
MKLHQIDLNLLLLFDALYRHRSVSNAAKDVYLSQSAFSHGLSRLRKHVSDELFIRINNVMEPTALAHELATHITPALGQIYSGLNNQSTFDPVTSDIEFTLSATDYTQFSLLPKLMSHLSRKAPNIKITITPDEEGTPTKKLMSNELDFMLGFSHEIEKSSTVESFTWTQDRYCTIARKGHPQLENGLTLETFLCLPHVRISPWGEKIGIVDQQLAKEGLKRHVALQLPSVLAAPYAIEHSDHLLTCPRVIAEQVSQTIDIELYSPPIPIPDYKLNLYWHKLSNSKASHRWFIDVIAQL